MFMEFGIDCALLTLQLNVGLCIKKCWLNRQLLLLISVAYNDGVSQLILRNLGGQLSGSFG